MNIAIDISPLSTGHKIRGVGFYLKNLQKALQEFYPDISFTFFTQTKNIPKNTEIIHYPYFEPFFLTLPFFKIKKTVVTVHDMTPLLFPDSFPVGIKGKIKWFFQKRALQKVDAIITDSFSSKKDITKLLTYPEKNIFVAHLAAAEHFRVIKDKSLLGEVKKKYALPEKFLLYVGDVTANKNLPRLIKAVLRTKIPLVMVGKALTNELTDLNNSWNKDLKEILSLIENKEQFIRLGFVDDEDLVEIYNLATAFIMPSLYEGFGLPVLEAMACGCPVIATKEGSLPEVAGDAAYYVDAYSIDAIQQGIQKLMGDKQMTKKLSENGLLQAKKFSWKKTAEETVEVYKKVSEV